MSRSFTAIEFPPAPQIEGYGDDDARPRPTPLDWQPMGAHPVTVETHGWLGLEPLAEQPPWPQPPSPLLLWVGSRPTVSEAAEALGSLRVDGRIGMDGPETDDDIPDVPHPLVCMALRLTPASLLDVGRLAVIGLGHVIWVLGLRLAPRVACRTLWAVVSTLATLVYVLTVVPFLVPRGARWRTGRELIESAPLPALVISFLARLRPQWRLLGQGAPALAGLLGVVWLLAGSTGASRLTYQRAAARAIADGDLAGARLLYERRLEIDSTHPEAAFDLALLLDRQGQRRAALAVLGRVLDETHGGHPRAHCWLALRLLGDDPGRRGQALARHQWRLALRADPDDVEANRRLAAMSLARGDRRSAESYLIAAARRDRGQRLALIRFYDDWAARATDRDHAAELRNRARQRARLVVTELEASESPDPLELGRVHRVLGHHAHAADLLRKLLWTAPSPAIRAELARCQLDWAEAVRHDGRSGAAQATELLLGAVRLDPASGALDRLVALASERGPEADRIVVLLAASGDEAEVLHARGRIALRRGQVAEAVARLEAAYQARPAGDVGRDLVRARLASERPDATRAGLALINRLVANAATPANRALRAEVHVRLASWAAALADLDVALRAAPAQPRLQQLRLELYERIERAEQARAGVGRGRSDG